jgi:hypothetical protein
MDAAKSFSFPFEDPDWLSKLGLGALISMIPILNFAWTGYLVDIIRSVMNNDGDVLSTWDDLGKKFNEGLILFGAWIVYASPILIAFCLPLGLIASSGLISGNSDMQDIGRILTEAEGVLFYCLLCVFILYALVLSIIYPVILVSFAREGTFASCFKLRQALDMIRNNTTGFFTAWVLSLAATIGTGLLIGFINLVVGWIPCIGWIVGLVLTLASGVYSTAVYAHLFGQFGRAAFAGDQLIPAG